MYVQYLAHGKCSINGSDDEGNNENFQEWVPGSLFALGSGEE